MLAAADWGTTRLRIWLMDGEGRVLAESRSDEGMATAAAIGFPEVLEKHLALMQAPAHLPVVICGMAGARQGWIEAPYLSVPAPLGDILGSAVAVPYDKRPVRIIPGLAHASQDAPDVMRGEETQIAGSAHLFAGRRVVCLPGTHSKWAEIEGATLTRFATWLTGELFSLLAGSSILRHAVEAGAAISPADPMFRKWVGEGLQHSADLTSLLFRIRAASLLRGLAPAEAAAALSGLLIGCEIASATTRFGEGGKVLLVSSGALGDLYAEALRLAGRDAVRADADKAVRAALFEAGRRCFLRKETAG